MGAIWQWVFGICNHCGVMTSWSCVRCDSATYWLVIWIVNDYRIWQPFIMHCTRPHCHYYSWFLNYKNSSGDEITNVDIFSTISHTYFKIASQVLRIKSWIYESATEFPPCCYRIFIRGRRAVPVQMFIARHSSRKLSMVMALSTTFTQCASVTTKFGKITKNKGHFAVQGHSGSPILVPIESSYEFLSRR